MSGSLDLTVRQASLEDMPAVTGLFRDTILQIGKSDYSERQINAWAERYALTDRWRDRIRHQHFLLAESEGEILGFGSVTSDAHIDTLYVRTDSQQSGVGGMLLEHLLDYVRERGHRSVYADVSLTGRSFFERQGFRLLKPMQKVLDGVVFVNFVMTRQL
jgi:putative acetyltransferase